MPSNSGVSGPTKGTCNLVGCDFTMCTLFIGIAERRSEKAHEHPLNCGLLARARPRLIDQFGARTAMGESSRDNSNTSKTGHTSTSFQEAPVSKLFVRRATETLRLNWKRDGRSGLGGHLNDHS
jgi:hypothetical protein